ncbi:dTDP-4-dehydrorhamnose reductase family protein [Sporobolomyces salmoneus]|uniref:dTDP-4-dehydrorhamnose reductase family protein n=1 Tax=Sporobolomyces salmoneus TaxID=183962 RepID=UPI0031721E13
MKVVVTGASGFLGRAVYAEFAKKQDIEVTGFCFSRGNETLRQLDLNDSNATRQLLKELKPDIVVHCAAERKPDVCECTPDKARNLNVVATSNLARLSSSLGFFLLYVSTDYVFPGNAPPQGYDVDDEPAPTNLYGITKHEGEKVVLEEQGAKATVLRIPVLCGPALSNSESAVNCLYDVVVQAAKKEKAAKMDDWAARMPTNTVDIARVIAQLSELSLKQSLPPILHYSAQECFTKYEISQIFARSHSPPLVLEDNWFVRDAAGPQPGDTVRPKDCHLSNRALEQLGIDCKTAQTFEEWAKEFVRGQEE